MSKRVVARNKERLERSRNRALRDATYRWASHHFRNNDHLSPRCACPPCELFNVFFDRFMMEHAEGKEPK